LPKFIKIRYKNTGDHLGDPASFNSHNMAGNFPGMKWPGQEEMIPGDVLDDKKKIISYQNPDKSREMITEKEYRARLHRYGGFTSQTSYHDPAPPALENPGRPNMVLPPAPLDGDQYAAFLTKQEFALLNFKHFNPICMEYIGEVPDDFKPGEKKVQSGSPKDIHITELDVDNSVKIIKQLKDVSVLNRLMDEEIKLASPRPEVVTALETQAAAMSK